MGIIEKSIRKRIICVVLGTLSLFSASDLAYSADVVNEARAALPKEVRDAGVLKVATNFSWPPFVYKSEAGEPAGIEVNLLKLLSAKLGLKPEFEDLKFPSIIPGVQSGRYDVGVNQIGATEERLKVVDILPYFDTGYGLLVRKGASDVDVNNLCGRTLVITQGSGLIPFAQELSSKCVANGKSEITIQYYPNTTDTLLALSNGRGDGFLTARAVGVYITKTNPKLDLAKGTLVGRHDIAGIVIRKGRVDLHQALLLALESSVADGSYKTLLDEFGVGDGAISVDQMRKSAL